MMKSPRKHGKITLGIDSNVDNIELECLLKKGNDVVDQSPWKINQCNVDCEEKLEVDAASNTLLEFNLETTKDRPMCSNCDVITATIQCAACSQEALFCSNRWEIHTALKKFRSHEKIQITQCCNCDSQPADWRCLNCPRNEAYYCKQCQEIHLKVKSYRGHQFQRLYFLQSYSTGIHVIDKPIDISMRHHKKLNTDFSREHCQIDVTEITQQTFSIDLNHKALELSAMGFPLEECIRSLVASEGNQETALLALLRQNELSPTSISDANEIFSDVTISYTLQKVISSLVPFEEFPKSIQNAAHLNRARYLLMGETQKLVVKYHEICTWLRSEFAGAPCLKSFEYSGETGLGSLNPSPPVDGASLLLAHRSIACCPMRHDQIEFGTVHDVIGLHEALLLQGDISLKNIVGELGNCSPAADVAALCGLYMVAVDARKRLAQALERLDSIFSASVSCSLGPLKLPARSLEKSKLDYGGNPLRLLDVVRASVVCADVFTMENVMGCLVDSCTGLVILRVKNGFEADHAIGTYGYRDIKVNVWISVGATEKDDVLVTGREPINGPQGGIIAEIQLHVRPFYQLKQHVGHKIYSWIRQFDIYGMTSPDIILTYSIAVAEATASLCATNAVRLLQRPAASISTSSSYSGSVDAARDALLLDEQAQEIFLADSMTAHPLVVGKCASEADERLGRELEIFCCFQSYRFNSKTALARRMEAVSEYDLMELESLQDISIYAKAKINWLDELGRDIDLKAVEFPDRLMSAKEVSEFLADKFRNDVATAMCLESLMEIVAKRYDSSEGLSTFAQDLEDIYFNILEAVYSEQSPRFMAAFMSRCCQQFLACHLEYSFRRNIKYLLGALPSRVNVNRLVRGYAGETATTQEAGLPSDLPAAVPADGAGIQGDMVEEPTPLDSVLLNLDRKHNFQLWAMHQYFSLGGFLIVGMLFGLQFRRISPARDRLILGALVFFYVLPIVLLLLFEPRLRRAYRLCHQLRAHLRHRGGREHKLWYHAITEQLLWFPVVISIVTNGSATIVAVVVNRRDVGGYGRGIQAIFATLFCITTFAALSIIFVPRTRPIDKKGNAKFLWTGFFLYNAAFSVCHVINWHFRMSLALGIDASDASNMIQVKEVMGYYNFIEIMWLPVLIGNMFVIKALGYTYKGNWQYENCRQRAFSLCLYALGATLLLAALLWLLYKTGISVWESNLQEAPQPAVICSYSVPDFLMHDYDGFPVYVQTHCSVMACPGDTIFVNGCPSFENGAARGATCVGDPVVRVADSRQETLLYPVDDSLLCAYSSRCPIFNATIPADYHGGCQSFDVKGGCHGGSGFCSADLLVYIMRAASAVAGSNDLGSFNPIGLLLAFLFYAIVPLFLFFWRCLEKCFRRVRSEIVRMI